MDSAVNGIVVFHHILGAVRRVVDISGAEKLTEALATQLDIETDVPVKSTGIFSCKFLTSFYLPVVN